MNFESNKITKARNWEKVYIAHDDLWGNSPSSVVLEMINYISSPVLDFGCGNGRNALFMAENGIIVTGIDVSVSAVNSAINKAISKGIDNIYFKVGDETSSYGKFNFILCLGVLHGVSTSERNNIMSFIYNSLNNDGKCIVSAFSEDDPTYNKCPTSQRSFSNIAVHLFSKSEFSMLLKDFKIYKLFTRTSVDDHSKKHNHKSFIALIGK